MKSTNHLWPLLPCLLLLTGCGGCRDSKTTAKSREAHNAALQAKYRPEMFLYAIDNLNQLEEFNSGDSLQELLQRFDPQNEPKPGQPEHPIDPLLAAWPEPEMFRQVVDQLNQWILTQPPPADWMLDPMTVTLPKPLLELPQVKNLEKMEFSSFDGFALQEAAWLRDVSLWAKGDGQDELDRVRSLFDWTVRNVQLEPDRPDRIPQFPRETLLLGHGTPSERAWLFILLLRQLNIDAAVLAIDEGRADGGEKSGEGKVKSKLGKGPGGLGTSVPSKTKKPQKPRGNLRPWCVGVLIEGEVYLFDPFVLGLPIPAPNGVKLDATGQLTVQPATLAQVIADDKLLRRLDYDESRVYNVKASDLKRVTALLEASPPYLARSMKAIQSQLSGARKMVLTTSPSTQAEHWKAAHVDDAQLWFQPFVTLYQRSHLDWRESQRWFQYVLPLYMVYEEKQEAHAKKTSMLPKGLEVEESQGRRGPQVVTQAAPLYKARVLYLKGKFTGDEGAIHYFQIAMPSHRSIALSSADEAEKLFRRLAKMDAIYWSGLISYQQGNYPAAIDYFLYRTLELYPDGPWTHGARYNLARSYEAKGETQRAILLYGGNTASPGYMGDLLRARWLRELGEKSTPDKE